MNPWDWQSTNVKIVRDEYLPKTRIEKYQRRLTMGEQWKRWGLNLWRYKEFEEDTRIVKDEEQCWSFGNTLFMSKHMAAKLESHAGGLGVLSKGMMA